MKDRGEFTVAPARGAGERERTGGEGGDIVNTIEALWSNRHKNKYFVKSERKQSGNEEKWGCGGAVL